MKKRILSILLTLCMLLSLVPTTAFAVSSEYTVTGYTAIDGTAGFSGEGYANLVDGSTNTKWCTNNFSNCYIIFSVSSAVNVSGYTITTANDNVTNTGRNPNGWTLYGCNDYTGTGTGTWTEIHSVTDDTVLQDVNYTSYDYFFEKTEVAYQYFKLVINGNKGSDVMQMSEFALINCDHSWNTVVTDPTCTTEGYTTKTCSVCNGEIIYDPVPALGHNIEENGICKNCGKTEIELFSYTYLDENGTEQSHYRPNEITSESTTLTGTAENPGWYIVNSNVTVNNRITVSGTVNLILADDCTLVVSGGIQVEEPDSLTVYAQSTDDKKGTLVANNMADCDAAIGGNGREVKDGGNGNNCGTVTINGGEVWATGKDGAGIGGGAGYKGGSGGTVIINGGSVYSYGRNGAGIGGGTGYDRGGDGGNVTVSGGYLEIQSDYADAIGGGYGFTQLGYFSQNNGGSGTFSTGTNGNALIYVSGYGTDIADVSGRNSWSGMIIEGYDAYVYGSSFILKEDCDISNYMTLTVTEGSKLTIADGVTLTNHNSMTNNGTIVNNGTLGMMSYFCNNGTIENYNNFVIDCDSVENRGTINNNGNFINQQDNTLINSGTINNYGTFQNYGVITDNGVFTNEGQVMGGQPCATVSFLSGYGEVQYSAYFSSLSSDSTTWTNYMYVADGDVTIDSRVTVSGEVALILSDNCNLTVNGGIQVEGTATLNIYSQSYGENMGTLTIQNVAENDAAIGGDGSVDDEGGTCGTVNILGGKITVNSINGAAIGGGGSENNDGGSGGTVNLYGGNVTAVSTNGAAIGGGGSENGNGGSGSTVEIYGSNVTAKSTNGAAIGGGSGAVGGSGGDVTVVGYNITAESTNGAGIGGGKGADDIIGDSGVFNTYSYGWAIINTTSIADQSNKDDWCCVTVIGDEIHVYGEAFWLYEDFTVEAGQTLTVEDGCELNIDESVTLTNNGTVINNGTIDNYGTINNKGNFNNNGIVYNRGTITGLNYYTVTFVMYEEYDEIVEQCIFSTGPQTAVFPYNFGGDDYEFVGWYNGDTKYDLNETVTQDITLTAKWVYVNVTTPEELENVVALGVSSVRLLADITLSKPLDLSDLNIYLNLNGHTLTGDLYIADTSAGAESQVYITNGNNMLEGVLNGNITLTDGGGGTASRIVAVDGTVTGNINLDSSIAEIANSGVRDCSTSFKGNVDGVGEIHGGTFYGKVNKELIKEHTVTFMNGGICYAIQAVSSDGWPVEPAYSPFRSEEEPFLGWYNGDSQYKFGYFRLSNDLVLNAKFGDHNYVKQEVLGEHPHTVTWVCSYCGDVKKESSVNNACLECNFTIELTETDTYELSAYIGTDTILSIPSEYKGISVTKIGTSCFKDNSTITEVVIPDTITSIGALAFMDCDNLTKVTIPATVTSIGSYAFNGFNGTIYCTKGSYAHEFALANDVDYVLTDGVDLVNLVETKTDSTVIDRDANTITTSIESCNDILDILIVSDYVTLVPVASFSYSGTDYFGTGSTITVFEKGVYVCDYTVIVTGDVNGDSVCDVLDASQVASASTGLTTLSGAYKTAADTDSDGTVDADDYQNVVNLMIA
ncbi:MAG: leucine-rich repeat protein [Acutalibacteraceae bacterium]